MGGLIIALIRREGVILVMCYECAAEPLVCSLSRQEVTNLNMQKPEHWDNEQKANDVDYAHTENE